MTSPFRKSLTKRSLEAHTPVRQRRRLYDGRMIDPDGMLLAPASPGPKPFTPGRLRISFNMNKYHKKPSDFTKFPALSDKLTNQDEIEEEEEEERIIVLDGSSDNDHAANRPTGIEWECEQHANSSRINASHSVTPAPPPPVETSSYYTKRTSFQMESSAGSTKSIARKSFINEFGSPTTPDYCQDDSLKGIEYTLPFSMMVIIIHDIINYFLIITVVTTSV